jgi:thiol-disulfide isomerase/thioredoxin
MKRAVILIASAVLIAAVAVVVFGNRYMAAKSSPVPAAAGAASGDKIKIISNGEAIDLNNYLVKGRVVVFDFYADWCGPCRVLGPRVEALVLKYNDVILRKINIVNWTSPVAKKYEIQFVPNVRVYDKQGKMVGEPTPSYEAIEASVNQARK